jgi:hypothetical protein
LPFLHLARRNVDALGLATTTHREENVELRETMILITLGNHVKGKGVIENMIVEGEVTAAQMNL